MTQPYRLSAALCLCLAAGMASAADRAAAWRAFHAHFDACHSVYGYDPAQSEGLGDHELGRIERYWRACVYDGVERFLVTGAKDPKSFKALIRSDKTLTDKIEAGQATRQERHAVIKDMVAKIKSAEAEAIAAAGPQAGAPVKIEDSVFNRRTVDSLRGLGGAGRF